MYYVVTGGLGFIGSNIVRALHKRGEKVIIIDDLASSEAAAEKLKNVSDCVTSIIDIVDYRSLLEDNTRMLRAKVENSKGVFHQGACSDTLVADLNYMLDANTHFSQNLIAVCELNGIDIVYASSAAVYGSCISFREMVCNEKPLNIYGTSKLLVDNFVRQIFEEVPKSNRCTIVGLRYFNVYGNGERHKGHMMSMPSKIARQLKEENGRCLLFEYGEQQRDFVHVDDVVDVNMHFMFDSSKKTRGIFNVGTGTPAAFKDMATMVIEHVRPFDGHITYVKMPDTIEKVYQDYTKADLTALRAAGYTKEFTSLKDGIRRTFG